jgi:EpsI family protein
MVGWTARDIEVSKEEQRVAGMSTYVMRQYRPPQITALLDAVEASGDTTLLTRADSVTLAAASSSFNVYVGYYENQTQGKTIHSPKNCLPGGGWEPLTATTATIATALGPVTVNRYLIGNGPLKSLVLYWYQGRGRVEHNEYAVKWDLLRDQALLGRSDEALVRVIVPVRTTEDAAYEQAEQVAKQLVVHVDRALPART